MQHGGWYGHPNKKVSLALDDNLRDVTQQNLHLTNYNDSHVFHDQVRLAQLLLLTSAATTVPSIIAGQSTASSSSAASGQLIAASGTLASSRPSAAARQSAASGPSVI